MAEVSETSSSLGDELSPAERAYFESGGESVDGLAQGADDAAAAASKVPSDLAEAAVKSPPDGAAKSDAAADSGTRGAKATDAAKKAEPGSKAAGDDYAADDAAADLAAHDQQKPPPQRVSYHKYRREEERRRKAEAALADLQEKYARGDERLKLLTEALAPQDGGKAAAQEDPEPDPDQDLVGWIKWSAREHVRQREAIASAHGSLDRHRDEIVQRNAADDLRSTYQRDALAFARQTPDFMQAYNHLLNARAAQLDLQGHSHDEIRKILDTEEHGLVQRAIQTRRSPAEMIYKMAEHFGYQKPAAPPPSAATEVAANGNGAALAAADAKPSVADEIARIQKGQEAAKTLSGAGSGGSSELTVEALALMNDREFEALLAKKPDLVATLMGRPN